MTALRRAPRLTYVDRRDYSAILNLARVEEHQSPYILENTAFEIWRLIDGTRTEDEIVDELAWAVGSGRATIARDTLAFIVTLRELGLIEDGDGHEVTTVG